MDVNHRKASYFWVSCSPFNHCPHTTSLVFHTFCYKLLLKQNTDSWSKISGVILEGAGKKKRICSTLELSWHGKQSEIINHFSCARGSLELQGVKSVYRRNKSSDGLRHLNLSCQGLAFGQKHALPALTKYFESDTSSEHGLGWTESC